MSAELVAPLECEVGIAVCEEFADAFFLSVPGGGDVSRRSCLRQPGELATGSGVEAFLAEH